MKDHDNLQAFSMNDSKIFSFYINSWVETKRILVNKPTLWQKLLVFLKIRELQKPLYHVTALIYIAFPHALRIGDIFMLPNDTLFAVTGRYHRNNTNTEECYQVTTIKPIEKYIIHTGMTFIVSHSYVEEYKNVVS